MRTKRKSRLLSLGLCLCMLVSIIPMSGMTYAAEGLADEFTMTPENPRVGEKVTFTGPDTVDGKPVKDWEWDFGDGYGESGKSPSHTYRDSANHTVWLTVTTEAGKKSLIRDITVSKWQPRLEIQGEKDITYTYGEVLDIPFKLSGASGGSLNYRLKIPGLKVDDTGSIDMGERKSYMSSSKILLVFEPGTYPIYGAITGDGENEDFPEQQIGSVTVQKATPEVVVDSPEANRFTHEAGNCDENSALSQIRARGYAGDEEIPAEITCNGVVLYSDTLAHIAAMMNAGRGIGLDTDALNTIPPGTYDIFWETPESAHNNAVRAKVGEATFTGVKSVTVTPTEVTVQRGEDTPWFKPEVETVGDGIDTTVYWSLSGNTSQKTTIISAGADSFVNLGADEGAETLTLTVKSFHENGAREPVSATALIHVGQVRSVALSPEKAAVEKGKTQSFTAQVEAVNEADESLTWSVDGADSSIDENGLLTVGKDETAKTLTVTAVSNYNNEIKATAEVTVLEPHTHSYGDWQYDKDNHWKECTAGDSIIDKAPHTAAIGLRT